VNLTVLSVAYPFAPVSQDAIGGAEQVLSRLDRAVAAAGGRSIVIAAENSKPAGVLIPVRLRHGDIDELARCEMHQTIRDLIAAAVSQHRPDLIHFHGVDFQSYLPLNGPPCLATLHLPLAWYPATLLQAPSPDLWLVPVSADQVSRGPPGARLIAPVNNGIDVEAFEPAPKRSFAVALGRICPEKGFHLALDAARAAGVPLLLAGAVFPYREHRRYFEEEIRPRLDHKRRWIGAVVGPAKKR